MQPPIRATPSRATFRSRHVPELDGLRGIAIISVLIHHQLTTFSLKGGFLGVDLFFVLSGFLITGILLSEFEKTQAISLRNFYIRRVLRLGPGLLVYLIACLLVTYHAQLVNIPREIKLIAIALVYSTNWRMAFGWDSYLDPTAIIWSLSIEEQFYLVWPVLLFGCLALKVRRGFIVAGLGITIFAIMVQRGLLLNAGVDLTRLYYGTDTRADALLIGCLLALLTVTSFGMKMKRWVNIASIFSAVGLIYFIATTKFTDLFLYRGGYTLIALLAGIVILVAANSPPRILSTALRIRPLRWFGKISYGLYLWHWLVVISSSFYYLGYWEPWAKLALAVGIASASFYLVERPINRLKTRFAMRPSVDQRGVSPLATDKAPSSIRIPLTN
ncbi:MAG: acyltransferase [Acidobacteriota bacterium]|nr:acyltransferase [Acidobacteriota bacterium]